MAAKVNYAVYDVTIVHPATKSFVRENTVATNDVRAFMKVLAGNEKMNNLDVDDVEYTVNKISSFEA